MQNKTELVGVSVRERLAQSLKGNQKWLAALFSAAGGYVMASSGIFGGISPFGVAFCASLQGANAIAASLGAIMGYTFSAAMLTNMKYIAAVLLVAGIKWVFGGNFSGELGKKFIFRHNAATAMLITFLSLLVASGAILLTAEPVLYDLLLAFTEILLACGAAYFFTRSLFCLYTGASGASRADLSCVAVSFAIVVMGFSAVTISRLSVGRMLCVLVILFCAHYGGEAGGSIAGVTSGIAMALSGGDPLYVVAAYAFGGLIAGVFGNMGRIAAAASFVIVNAVVAFISQASVDLYAVLLEVFVSSVIFMAVPQSWVNKLRPSALMVQRRDDGSAQSILRDRLSDISASLSEIGSATRKVSEGLLKLEEKDPFDITAKVSDRVCQHCGSKSVCWQLHYNDTMAAMSEVVIMLKKSGGIGKAHAPLYLARSCCKLADLLAEFNVQFQGFTSRQGTARKISQVRSVVTDQFEGMALMLQEISGEFCAIKALDEQKAKRVKDYFEKEGFHINRVQAFTDESERMTVEFTMPNFQIERMHKTKAALDLCGMLEAEFDLPQITTREQYATIVFTERAVFTIELGTYQIASGGNRLCGDAYDYIRSKAGCAHFILSDGMGCGGNAAVDSSMASGLITRLLSVGVGHEAALKMVNSALIIKSGEESLATIDISTVDLLTGRADFYKAGAAPTYLIKNGKAGFVESTSLPAGILRGVTFEHSGITLCENDVIVMVSDGVTVTGVDWVKSELESMRAADMQRLAEKLATTAKIRRTDNREDDITVLAVALRRSG